MKKTSTLDWLILTGLVIAWGSSFAMTKVAMAHLDAAWIMALRLSVAGLVLAPYAMFSGESFFASGAVWRKFTWLALIDPGKLLNLSMSSWESRSLPIGP